MSDRRVVWCLGMFSSASTWMYNAALKVANALHPNGKVETKFIPDRGHLPVFSEDADALIVKTHGVSGQARTWLARRADAIIVTIRDPRDAVTPLMEHYSLIFGDALDFTQSSIRACEEFCDDPRATTFRYRDGFPDDPATIQHLAQAFGGVLTPCAAERIFAELRRPAIEAFIEGIPSLPTAMQWSEMNDVFDRVTHWHKHHAGRSGRPGRWRERLVPAQVTMLETTIDAPSDWYDDDLTFGYRLTLGSG